MNVAADWTRRSVLVTGAGGFIGSHLAERLVTLGARTKALVRYNSSNSWGWLDSSAAKDSIEVILGDVRDRDTVENAMRGVDTVFHLAALIAIPYSYLAPMSYVQTNVEGTLNVLHEVGSAKSVVSKIEELVAHYYERTRPFLWIATADPILSTVE